MGWHRRPPHSLDAAYAYDSMASSRAAASRCQATRVAVELGKLLRTRAGRVGDCARTGPRSTRCCRSVPVVEVLPVAVEPSPGIVSAARRRTRHAGRVQLSVANVLSTHRARDVDQHRTRSSVPVSLRSAAPTATALAARPTSPSRSLSPLPCATASFCSSVSSSQLAGYWRLNTLALRHEVPDLLGEGPARPHDGDQESTERYGGPRGPPASGVPSDCGGRRATRQRRRWPVRPATRRCSQPGRLLQRVEHGVEGRLRVAVRVEHDGGHGLREAFGLRIADQPGGRVGEFVLGEACARS